MRRFISLNLFFSLILLSLSGIVLFFAPHGRIAHWVGWKFLFLSKEDWENLHTVFGFLFLTFAVFHIVFNFKALKKYFSTKEVWFSLGITVLVLLLTIFKLPPVSQFLIFRDKLVQSIENRYPKPPIPHAELMMLKTLCKKLGIPLDVALRKLKTRGVKATPNQKLLKIAEENNLTPEEVYRIISSPLNR